MALRPVMPTTPMKAEDVPMMESRFELSGPARWTTTSVGPAVGKGQRRSRWRGSAKALREDEGRERAGKGQGKGKERQRQVKERQPRRQRKGSERARKGGENTAKGGENTGAGAPSGLLCKAVHIPLTSTVQVTMWSGSDEPLAM